MSDGERDTARERRRLVRRATLYTVGFFAAAVLVAVVGAAIIAWMLSNFGLPFRPTWLIIAALVLGVPLLAALVRALWRRAGGRDA